MKKFIIVFVALLILCACQKQTSIEPELEDPKVEKVAINDTYSEITGEGRIYYAEQEEVLNMLKHGTGIVFFSWIDCPWCHRYVNNLNEALLKADTEALYYDIYEDRQNNTEFYQQVKELLNTALEEEGSFDKEGATRIYVPMVVFVKEGAIVHHNNESSMESGFEENAEPYWATVIENGKTREELLVESFNLWALEIAAARAELDSKGCSESSACKL